MSGTRTKYDEEFKRNAVKLSRTSPKSTAQVARDLGIHVEMLYTWRRKYTSKGEKSAQAVADEETKQLLKENARLRMEVDMLKKATAYFASLHK